MPAGIFGITDETVNLVVNLLLLFLGVVWLALIAWTYFDARRRIEDPVLVAFATAAALFPYVGSLVYAILRPPELLEDRHERELEIRAAELRVRQLEEQSCPNCEHPVDRTFLRCPSCRARIKRPCPACAEPVDPRWSVCPYCETALRRAAPAERRPEEVAKRRAEPQKRRAEPAKQRKAKPARKPAPSGSAASSSSSSSASPSSSADGEPGKQASQRKPRSSKPRSDRARESSSRPTSSKPRG